MKRASAWKLLVVALVVLVVAAALVVPDRGCALARVGGDGSTAAECQSGHSCGGAPVAACVRAGTRAAEGRSRSGRCRVRTPCARAGPLAAADPANPTEAGG